MLYDVLAHPVGNYKSELSTYTVSGHIIIIYSGKKAIAYIIAPLKVAIKCSVVSKLLPRHSYM